MKVLRPPPLALLTASSEAAAGASATFAGTTVSDVGAGAGAATGADFGRTVAAVATGAGEVTSALGAVGAATGT